MADNVSALGNQRMVLQGLPQRLIQDGLVDEKTMTQAMAAAKEANANLVSHLVDQRHRRRPRDRHRRLAGIRRAAARPRRDAAGPRHRQAGLRQAARQAPRAAAGQARQAAVRRRLRPDQPARARRDQVPDRPVGRSGRRRGGQAPEDSPTRRSSRSTRRCRRWATTTSTSRISTSPAATRSSTRTRSAATTSKTRRSCASSTRCCSTRSRKAPRTSTSSRTRRPTASACASTAT